MGWGSGRGDGVGKERKEGLWSMDVGNVRIHECCREEDARHRHLAPEASEDIARRLTRLHRRERRRESADPLGDAPIELADVKAAASTEDDAAGRFVMAAEIEAGDEDPLFPDQGSEILVGEPVLHGERALVLCEELGERLYR